ncbi:MAG: response regulator transcription factor [Anaerolineales bacterium]
MAESQAPKANILWAGKNRVDTPAFVPDLKQRDYQVTVVSTGKAARQKVPKIKPDILIIDAASMRTTGTRICKSIQSIDPDLPIILINSANYIPTNNVVADVQLILPFTIRKLENRIIPLIPGDGEEVIEAGPIHLDIDRQTVRCQDNEEHITPRMVELLKMLMEKAGGMVEREVLFSKVWQTDYTEDTRSLDVHINWLRKAIEKDPNNPELIITIRGKGYKLEI